MPASASQARHSLSFCAALALAAALSVGAKCDGGAVAAGARANVPAAETGHALFTSPQTNPVALSNKGDVLYVANTTTGTLSVFGIDKQDPANLTLRAEIPVGLDPVSVAVRPGGGGDELVLVANHLSDSISVVSKKKLEVVQTIQGLDAQGVTTTNEPVSVVFASKKRAFVALDEPDQVIVIDFKGSRAEINPQRLQIGSKAPRAMTVVDEKLYVLSFESGNQTEFPTCAPDDPRILGAVPLDENSDVDEGCEFSMTIFDGFGAAAAAGAAGSTSARSSTSRPARTSAAA